MNKFRETFEWFIDSAILQAINRENSEAGAVIIYSLIAMAHDYDVKKGQAEELFE